MSVTNSDPSAVAGGEVVGIPSTGQAVRALAAALAPRAVSASEASRLSVELLRIVAGRSEVRPEPRDRRFADPAWNDNPLFRRLAQAYIAGGSTLTRLVDDLEANTEDHRRAERARFASNLVVATLAPTNLILTNPAGLKRAFDTGGASVARGATNFLHDLRHNGGLPSTVDASKFEVGRDLATSPGAVVARDEMAELIQYTPSTPSVRKRPLLVVPPPIGRYYFLDLRPGRSFVEFAVSQGFQVFLLSWRNPGPVEGDWVLDDYAARVSTALDTVLEITGQPDANLMGFCAGGIISTTLLNHIPPPVTTGCTRCPTGSRCSTSSRRLPRRLPEPPLAQVRQQTLDQGRGHHQPADGCCVHSDATRRPRLQLRGQQLRPWGTTPSIRHPGVEHDGTTCPEDVHTEFREAVQARQPRHR